jgi:hypothetical protein
MQLITPFNPSLASSGTIVTNGINTGQQLMLYNDSIYGLQLTFADGSNNIIPALWNEDFIMEDIPMGKVSWKIYNTLNLAQAPICSVYGVIYEKEERVASVNASMQRTVNASIPGGVVLTAGIANELQNDSNTNVTPILEVTPAGVGASSQTATVGGLWTLGSIVGGAIVTWLQSFNGASGTTLLNLGALNYIVDVLGKLTVTQLATLLAGLSVTGGINTDSIATTGNGTVGGTLGVTGTSTLASVICNVLTASGLLTANSGLTVNNGILTDTLTATSNASVVGTLNVTGLLSAVNQLLSGTLGVTGLATFVNAVFNGAMSWNPTATSAVGLTGGTFQSWQVSIGTVKLVLAYASICENNTAGSITVNIPTPFTKSMIGMCSGMPKWGLSSGGALQQIQIQTTLSTSGGATTPETTYTVNGIFHTDVGFDSWKLQPSQAFTSTGMAVLIGF